jgi:HK97 gp10 family phage protein
VSQAVSQMPDARVVIADNRLHQLADELTPKAERMVAKIALDLTARAKARAPVRTGNLKGSIQPERTGRLQWRVEVGAHYGIYVEFGTRRMRAQPYFVPAAEAVRPVFARAVARLFELQHAGSRGVGG